MNSIRARIIAAAALASLLAGCAATGRGSPDASGGSKALTSDQCVTRPLQDTRVLDGSTLLITDQSGRGALVHMSGQCLEYNTPVIMRYFGGGNICGPLDVDIASGGNGTIPQHCLIDHLSPLSRDEVQQILNKPRKKP